MEDDNWIYELMPEAEADQINAESIVTAAREQGGVTLELHASDEVAIQMCLAYKSALSGDTAAWSTIQVFLGGILELLETHLFEEGINPYEDSGQ